LIQYYFDAFSEFELYPDVSPALASLTNHIELALVSDIDADLLALTPWRVDSSMCSHLIKRRRISLTAVCSDTFWRMRASLRVKSFIRDNLNIPTSWVLARSGLRLRRSTDAEFR
jgi:hypothetical protein